MSTYTPVLRHPVMRRVLPGVAVSALGDGMSAVAVSWLALQLAPPGQRAGWVAAAIAAYTLPGALGAVALGRVLRRRPSATLVAWDATLRALALGAIPAAWWLGTLNSPLYVVLLALSSLLRAWGSAGRFSLVAQVLPREHHLAANAVLNLLAEATTLVGPPLAGLLIAWRGAPFVLALDAATFAVLAASFRLAVPNEKAAPEPPEAARRGGMATIRRDRRLLGLLVLSFGFFALYGPVLVALPVQIADAGQPATRLALFYAAFGAGAVAGSVLAGYLKRWRLWPTTIGIVLGFGASLLPLGLGAPLAVSLVSFGLGGLIWAPYPATSMALFQRSATPERLAAVLAALTGIMVPAVPLGTMLGGLLVAGLGADTTVLFCGLGMLGLGIIAAALSRIGAAPAPDEHRAGDERDDAQPEAAEHRV